MRQLIKSAKIVLILWIIIFFNLLLINSVTAQTWQITSIPTSETQRSIHFISAGVGWSAGYNGTILHTTDGAVNWSLQTSHTSERFLAIRFIDHDIGWAGTGRIIVRAVS